LRIIHNRTDSISLERIANVPPRGIGDVTFARIIGTKNPDLIAAIAQAAEDHSPTSRSGSALRQLHGALAQLSSDIGQKTPSQLLRDIIKTVNYESYIRSLKGGADDTIEDRLENIQEFLTVAARYDVAGPEGLAQFLEEVALLQEAARSREGERTVTLMTIHAAKGLEFPVVIVAGMEEGLFPHSRTIYAPHELEEERRLCYVALTRAKDLLFITFARWRSIFGARHANIPSRFLGEIPEALLTWQKLDSDFSSERESYVDYDE
jgi:DNA helicase II / ATP-dependent DNA helicase PcrA